MFANSSSRRPDTGRRPPAARLGVAVLCLCPTSLVLTACAGAGADRSGVTTVPAPPPTTSASPSPADTSPTNPTTGSPTTGSPTPTPAKPAPRASTTSPSARVISFRETYSWNWPNDPTTPGKVRHRPTAPVIPQLVRINAGQHPHDPGEYGFDRISFAFTSGLPSYRFEFADLLGDPSGRPVPVTGMGTLTIVFSNAQAHTSTTPVRSSIVTQPKRPLNYDRLVDYAQAGDFEAVLTYGLGMRWDVLKSNPQLMIRVSELETAGPNGVHQYVVAFDAQLGNVARH